LPIVNTLSKALPKLASLGRTLLDITMKRLLASLAAFLFFLFGSSFATAASTTPSTIEVNDELKLTLEVTDNQLMAFFADATGTEDTSSVDSIIFVVDDTGHRHDKWRAVLRLADNDRYTSPRRLYPPYKFRARLIIRFTDGETVSLPNLKLDLQKN
jgi:hypothetical protein